MKLFSNWIKNNIISFVFLLLICNNSFIFSRINKLNELNENTIKDGPKMTKSDNISLLQTKESRRIKKSKILSKKVMAKNRIPSEINWDNIKNRVDESINKLSTETPQKEDKAKKEYNLLMKLKTYCHLINIIYGSDFLPNSNGGEITFNGISCKQFVEDKLIDLRDKNRSIVFDENNVQAFEFTQYLTDNSKSTITEDELKLKRKILKIIINSIPVDFCYKTVDFMARAPSSYDNKICPPHRKYLDGLCYIDQCTKKNMVDCGVGACARNNVECRKSVTKMVLTPFQALGKIFSLTTFISDLPTTIINQAEAGISKTVELFEAINDIIDTSMKSIGDAIAGNLEIIRILQNDNSKNNLIKNVNDVINRHYSKLFGNNKNQLINSVVTDFLQFLKKNNEDLINRGQGIEEESKCKDMKLSKDCIEYVSNFFKLVDPVGIVNLIQAYNHELCDAYSLKLNQDAVDIFYEFANQQPSIGFDDNILVVNLTNTKINVKIATKSSTNEEAISRSEKYFEIESFQSDYWGRHPGDFGVQFKVGNKECNVGVMKKFEKKLILIIKKIVNIQNCDFLTETIS